MHIIGVTDFPLFCSNFARKCLILPAECSPQISLILLEILPSLAGCLFSRAWHRLLVFLLLAPVASFPALDTVRFLQTLSGSLLSLFAFNRNARLWLVLRAPIWYLNHVGLQYCSWQFELFLIKCTEMGSFYSCFSTTCKTDNQKYIPKGR